MGATAERALVRTSWHEPALYLALRFTATIANAAPPWRERILGCEVELRAREPRSRPYVVAAREPWLKALLDDGWTTGEYEAAVATFG